MNILFCGDKNVQDGLLIAVLSLLENTQEHLDIYVLTLDMSMNGRIYSPIEQTFVDYLNETVSAQYDFLKMKHRMRTFQQDLHHAVC